MMCTYGSNEIAICNEHGLLVVVIVVVLHVLHSIFGNRLIHGRMLMLMFFFFFCFFFLKMG